MTKIDKINNLSEIELLEIGVNYRSATDYCKKVLNYSGGRYVTILKQKMKDLNIEFDSPRYNNPYIDKTCPVCEKIFRTKSYGKNSSTTCSGSCSNTHFRTGTRYKNGGSKEYRTYALNNLDNLCNRCYIDDIDVLVIHHIDRNRINNKLSNLEILCANCHMKEHKKNWLVV